MKKYEISFKYENDMLYIGNIGLSAKAFNILNRQRIGLLSELSNITEKDLYTKEVTIGDINYFVKGIENKKIEIEAKVRYRSKPAKAILYPLETGKAKIIFEEAQRAVTPGQSLVFYDNDIVLGGGKIL